MLKFTAQEIRSRKMIGSLAPLSGAAIEGALN